MIVNQYCTFEISTILKKLGYPEADVGDRYYFDKNGNIYHCMCPDYMYIWCHNPVYYVGSQERPIQKYPCIRLIDIRDWIMDKYKIFILVDLSIVESYDKPKYFFSIRKLGSETTVVGELTYNSYYKALLEGINEVLNKYI